MITNQIGWVIPDHGAYEGLAALKASGKKVICIDPVRTETCASLDAEWIAPRPQTDVALMLGIAHTLKAEKLQDDAFLDEYTVGFDKFRPIYGRNGQHAEISGVGGRHISKFLPRRSRIWRVASPKTEQC